MQNYAQGNTKIGVYLHMKPLKNPAKQRKANFILAKAWAHKKTIQYQNHHILPKHWAYISTSINSDSWARTL